VRGSDGVRGVRGNWAVWGCRVGRKRESRGRRRSGSGVIRRVGGIVRARRIVGLVGIIGWSGLGIGIGIGSAGDDEASGGLLGRDALLVEPMQAGDLFLGGMCQRQVAHRQVAAMWLGVLFERDAGA
jgi:hypothetical protein